MSTLHDLLKARFAMARQDLEQVLSRLSDADVLWAPREEMRSVGGQLLEIANKEKETLAWIQQGIWPDEDADAFDAQASSIASIKAALDSIRADTIAYIDSHSESELHEPIPCPERWWEALRLSQCPRSEVLRNVAAHEWYHTGQLVSYLWMRGDDPNAW